MMFDPNLASLRRAKPVEQFVQGSRQSAIGCSSGLAFRARVTPIHKCINRIINLKPFEFATSYLKPTYDQSSTYFECLWLPVAASFHGVNHQKGSPWPGGYGYEAPFPDDVDLDTYFQYVNEGPAAGVPYWVIYWVAVDVYICTYNRYVWWLWCIDVP